MSSERQNTVYVGGTMVQRESGGYTVTNPVCVYGNVTDDHLMEFWHEIGNDPEFIRANNEYAMAVSKLLIAWGDKKKLEVKTGSSK